MRRARKLLYFFLVIISIPPIFIVKNIKENVCINSVRRVKSFLKRNISCPKLKVQSREECNEYDDKMFNKVTDSNLELELENCQAYINSTKVNYHLEEEKTPLAFSILAHRDAVQLSRLDPL